MKRWVFVAAAAIGVVLLVYGLFFWSDDEELIHERLDYLEEVLARDGGNVNPGVEALRYKGDFQEIFAPDVEVQIAEMQSGSKMVKRGELAAFAAQAATRYKSTSVSIGSRSVDLVEDSATVTTTTTLNAVEGDGTPRRESRAVTFRFVKVEDEWLIEGVEAGEREGDSAWGP